MRIVLLLLAAAAVPSGPQIQFSHTTESLRGVSAVSRQIAWASGTHGTYLRTTDAGVTWTPAQVPDATTLDFRAVVAFSATEAFLMSAGPGDQSRIYHTSDAGQHWQLQFTNTNPKGFFDSMVFWDPKHGVVLGDPIPDDSGKLKFELLMTDDGETWKPIPPAQLPEAKEGEGAFAASNTCMAILPWTNVVQSEAAASAAQPPKTGASGSPQPTEPGKSGVSATREPTQPPRSGASALSQPTEWWSSSASASPQPTESWKSGASATRESTEPGGSGASASPQPTESWKSGASAPRQPSEEKGALAPEGQLWFATGGKTARVFHSPDRGQTWQVFDTPILHGPDSAGIFSIAFRDALHGVIAGGDYKHPNADGPNLAFTNDGGKTWTLSDLHPQAYFSAAAYDRHVNDIAPQDRLTRDAAGKKKTKMPIAPQRLFIIGDDFIFDFRPPNNPRRINGTKKQAMKFNAVSAFPEGGALIVGPKGSIAMLP